MYIGRKDGRAEICKKTEKEMKRLSGRGLQIYVGCNRLQRRWFGYDRWIKMVGDESCGRRLGA